MTRVIVITHYMSVILEQEWLMVPGSRGRQRVCMVAACLSMVMVAPFRASLDRAPQAAFLAVDWLVVRIQVRQHRLPARARQLPRPVQPCLFLSDVDRALQIGIDHAIVTRRE